MDLGALFQPQGQEQAQLVQQPALAPPSAKEAQAPDLKSQWDSVLQNPTTQAALLSFGIRALQGGWGGVGSQLGDALSAGLEGASNQQVFQQAKEDKEQARADKLNDTNQDISLKREEFQNRKDIANIGASTRLSVAGMRQASGAKSLQEQKFYQAAYNKAAQGLRSNSIFTEMTEDEIANISETQAIRALEGYRKQFGSGETPNLPDGKGGNGSGGGSPLGSELTPQNTQPNTQAPVPTYLNPTTGKKATWDGTQWVIQ